MTLEGALETRRTEDDGAPVEFVFTITNTGSEPLEVQFADAASAEFIVYDGGQEVWRFTEGQAFMQLLSSDRLEPGESATYDASGRIHSQAHTLPLHNCEHKKPPVRLAPNSASSTDEDDENRVHV